MFEDNVITHRYSGRFTTSVSASHIDYSISDGSSFGSELSVEFVGNTLFSSRHSKFSSTLYSDKIDNSYRVSATSSLFTKRLTNQVYRDFTTAGSGSFISIHNEVQSGMSVPGIGGGITSTGKVYGGKPGGKPIDPPIGQKDPQVPVGDALIPMLLMIAVYAIVRFFSSRKKLQKINQSVNK